jgi:hypothetical protein
VHARCEAAQAAAAVGVHLRHADSCLRCQADAARRRRLARELHELRALGPDIPPALAERILARVETAAQRAAARAALRRRVAMVTAGAGGAAAVVAAVIGTRSRGRRVRITG